MLIASREAGERRIIAITISNCRSSFELFHGGRTSPGNGLSICNVELRSFSWFWCVGGQFWVKRISTSINLKACQCLVLLGCNGLKV
jgi:hypothetical protein